ncbi:MAG: carboxylating nicotinate-nucleotide diphosphorylase [Vicinamibacterales bacterium]
MQTERLDRGALALIDLALAEDLGSGDITTLATVPAERQATGSFLVKQPGVVSGLAVVAAVYERVDNRVVVEPLVEDGAAVVQGTVIATVSGPARALLSGERVALNFLQRLSGVATVTAEYVQAVAGTKAKIIDTRKTTPGMRTLQKEAIRHGGGHNHRLGLADGILIKDNHLAALGTPDRIAVAIAAARQRAPHTLKVEVEVTNLDELAQALEAGADVILLDNMEIPTMAEAVRQTAGRALLEASGGITLATIPAIAATGVDFISVGALTHSAPALDVSLELGLGAEG